jgi:hypothetical protein
MRIFKGGEACNSQADGRYQSIRCHLTDIEDRFGLEYRDMMRQNAAITLRECSQKAAHRYSLTMDHNYKP